MYIDTTCRAPERRDSFRPSIHVIDALERVQNEKHNTTNVNDIHHNKVDTSEYIKTIS